MALTKRHLKKSMVRSKLQVVRNISAEMKAIAAKVCDREHKLRLALYSNRRLTTT